MDGIRFDATKRLLEADVSVLGGEDSQTWTIRLTDVSQVRVNRPDEAGWDYTEVTEVHVEPGAAGTQVELVFWVEPNGLTATCGAVTVEAR